MPDKLQAVEWIAFGSNVFNAFVPLYADVDHVPAYFGNTDKKVTTESFYWVNRIIGALADAHYPECIADVERYQMEVPARAIAFIHAQDHDFSGDLSSLLETNQKIADMVKEKTDDLLAKVLYKASNGMKNSFARSDA